MIETDYVIVMTTMPADGDPAGLARALVDARLAACVNILAPMASVYRWEGRIEEEREQQLIIKTSRTRLAALWDQLRELHPYDVPEFIVLPIVDGNDAYLRWVGESTRTPE
jgi:periplasmic divalent cation tolerance protein